MTESTMDRALRLDDLMRDLIESEKQGRWVGTQLDKRTKGKLNDRETKRLQRDAKETE